MLKLKKYAQKIILKKTKEVLFFMSTLSIIFIVIIVCAELDFFALLFCNEISGWLKAKADSIHARSEYKRYSMRYVKQCIEDLKNLKSGTPDNYTDVPEKPEGSE